MQNLRKYVQDGQILSTKLNQKQQPVKVQLSELENQANYQNKMGKTQQSLQGLSHEERFEWANFKSLRANSLQKERKYDQAIEMYLIALVGMDFKDFQEGTIRQLKEEQLFPIMLNMATCFYKKKQYRKALELCDRVMKDSRFPAGIYRKAYILAKMEEIDPAKELLGELLKQPKNSFKGQAQNLLARIDDKKKKDRQPSLHTFRGNEDDSENSPLMDSQENEEILYPRDGIFYTIIDWITDCSRGITNRRRKNKSN